MIDEYGPYVQMSTLGEQMAACYQTDANLLLEPHLAHYMDEVEVNIAADSFNHVGFLNNITSRLQVTLTATTNRGAGNFYKPLWLRFRSGSTAIHSMWRNRA